MPYNGSVEMQDFREILFNRLPLWYSSIAPAVGFRPRLRLDNNGTAGVLFMPRKARKADCHPDKKHVAHGLCSACYKSWEIHGKTTSGNLCACGCGEVTRLGNKFINGHSSRGLKRSDETKAKLRAIVTGKTQSEETKAKRSAAMKGRKRDPEAVAKTAEALRGRKHSPETIEKLRVANKRSFTPEQRAEQSRRQTGRKYSESARENMRIAQRKVGRKLSTEHIKKIQDARKAYYEKTPREQRPGWRGGVSNSPYPDTWKSIRSQILRRDGRVCAIDPSHDLSGSFYNNPDVHHVDGNKKNCNPDNLISLCKKCHGKAQSDLSVSKPVLRKILSERYGYVYE